MVTEAERQSLTKKPFSSLLQLEASSKLSSMAITPTAGFVLIVYMPIAHMTSILHLMDQTQSVVGGLGWGWRVHNSVVRCWTYNQKVMNLIPGRNSWNICCADSYSNSMLLQQHVKVNSKAPVTVPKAQCGKL